MPPPATPSPRRFLPGKRHPSPNKNSKATPSGLRNQLSSGDAFDQQPKSKAKAFAPSSRRPERGDGISRPVEVESGDTFGPSTPFDRPSGAQFAQTPRFSYGRPPAQPLIRQSSAPRAEALRQRTEDVQSQSQEDRADDNEDEEMLELEGEEESIPTTDDDTNWTSDLIHSPKRRRLDETPGRPVFRHPTAPASRAPSTLPEDKPSILRPSFLRSAPSATEVHEPPPEAFSPHRRGEKFLAGGMAATLQQWVVETGQAAVQSRKGQGYLKGEDYVLCVKVESVSVSGSGPLTVSGRRVQDGDEVKLMLVVDGKKKVVHGSVVGIRAPIWEVEVEGGRWSVGVDWKVL